jgi:nucleotide-binding universal stress UspA family protein
MFRHILIGYDGSPHSKKALEHGIELARQGGAEITVVTAFAKLPDYLGASLLEGLAVRATSQAQATVFMGAEQARAAGIEKVREEVLEGNAAECLLRVAETRGCDLIVVGSRGHGEFTGLLLGSVSDRVAHHAKAPVLIVK